MNKFLTIFLLLTSFCFAQNISKETSHFIFNGEEKDITEEVINICEDQYYKVSQKSPKQPEKKISINIYADQLTYFNNINATGRSLYNIACFNEDDYSIDMVSIHCPNPVHYPLSLKATLVANIERSFLSLCYNLPTWLTEAIKSHTRTKILKESSLDYSNKIITGLQIILKKEENFKVANIMLNISSQFEKEYKTDKKIDAVKRAFNKTALSNSFIQYIIDNWGYTRLLQFSNDKNIYEVFGIQTQEFEKNWFEYTRNN